MPSPDRPPAPHVPVSLSRRGFLAAVAAAPAAALAACRLGTTELTTPAGPTLATLTARPAPPTGQIEPGTHRLALAPGRDGFLYVPATYRRDRPAPLLVLLHGAGQDSAEWSSSGALAGLVDGAGIVVVAPDSRGRTWDRTLGEFGPDVRFIDEALALAFRRVAVDPTRVGLGGFSDGASYALSLGLGNGDLFGALLAFSPGFVAPAARAGRPRVFVSHGTQDQVLPIDVASRRIVPQLRQDGYDVTYREFAGGHTLPLDVAREAIARWFPGAAGA